VRPRRLLLVPLALALLPTSIPAASADPAAEVGKLIFFDPTLSEPAGQACAT
jgi:cytochrome c peroxidase